MTTATNTVAITVVATRAIVEIREPPVAIDAALLR